MGRKKELLSSAPWRGDDEEDPADKFRDAKMKVTKNSPGEESVMHVPKKKNQSDADLDEDEPVIDPELRYSFQRNSQFLKRVFSVDTLVKPLPPAMGYNVSRNVNFFFRIFTQFWDEEGISNAQKSLYLAPRDEQERRVR
ncbi:hypothetical protein LUZ60_015913 [Juncus effusus]|nr:hypothetical protein LUZ60_015913 [Juncus effusus]